MGPFEKFGRNNLVHCIFQDQLISKNQVYQSLLDRSLTCQCKTPTVNWELQFFDFGKNVKPINCNKCLWKKTSLLVIMNTCIGFNKVQKEYLEILEEFLQLKGSVGGFMGSRSFGYYLIGSTANNFLFLDPHFVQTHATDFTNQSIKTFNVPSIKEINKFDISPFISFGCLLHNETDFNAFWEQLKDIHKRYPENHLFEFSSEQGI